MKITLRLASRKVPEASSRTCPSSTGVSEDELVEILEDWEFGAPDAVADRAGLPVGAFGSDQAGDERMDLIAPGKAFAATSSKLARMP